MVVIGAGPNGLTIANYLVRSGAKVLLVEQRHDIGGSLLTEDFGGSRYNLHAMYMPLGEEMPPYSDLELAYYGCLFVEPRAQVTLYLNSSRALTLYRDTKRSLKAIEKVAPSDSRRFATMRKEMESLRKDVILPWTYNSPLSPEKRKALLKTKKIGKLAERLHGFSPLQILQYYSIESEELKLILLYLGCIWGIDPSQEGVGLVFISFLDGMLRASLVRGGSYLLASSLYKQAVMRGVDVLVGREARKVTVKGNAVTGVELSDGQTVHTRSVVSTTDIKTSFQRLLGDDVISKDMSATAKRWQWDPWSLFQAHWTLKTTPKFKSTEGTDSAALMHIVGYEGVKDFLGHITSVMEGEPKPAGMVSFPTLVDGSQAAKGLTVAKFTTIAPFRLKEGSWDQVKDGFAEECFNTWSNVTSNTQQDAILWRYAYPPTYIEMKLANCFRGSLNGGAYTPQQLGYKRPTMDCSAYRTPVKGFYIGGASVHPGGGVTLAGGYNAASVVAKDLGLRRWWKSKYPQK